LILIGEKDAAQGCDGLFEERDKCSVTSVGETTSMVQSKAPEKVKNQEFQAGMKSELPDSSEELRGSGRVDMPHYRHS
jgi:hypothetical protein